MQAYLIVDADIYELYRCTVFRKLNTTNCYRNGFPSFIVFAYYFRKPTSKVYMYVFLNVVTFKNYWGGYHILWDISSLWNLISDAHTEVWFLKHFVVFCNSFFGDWLRIDMLSGWFHATVSGSTAGSQPGCGCFDGEWFAQQSPSTCHSCRCQERWCPSCFSSAAEGLCEGAFNKLH